MARKLIKQNYFVSKELRISISLIILWSLLVTAFFTYFAKELGEKIGNATLLFVIVMLGYIIIVVVLTMFFAHRLIGPFQRLNTEMRLIRSGDYHRRLNVRKDDDIYIRSFVQEVNKVLEEFDKVQQYKSELIEHTDSELLSIISLIEEGEPSKEKLREIILEFHKKAERL
jgi:signal transduction histidine kinase